MIRTTVKPMHLKKSASTHRSLAYILTAAQFCGTFPLTGLRGAHPENLRLQFTSLLMIYSVLVSASLLLCGTLAFYKSITEGIFLNQLGSPLFYMHAFWTTVIFIRMARKWPKFMNRWTKMEKLLDRKYKSNNNLFRKINLLATVMLLIALVEHSLSVVHFILSTKCHNNSTGFEYYFKKQFHFVFRFIPYNVYLASILTILSWMGTFVWNFGDMFIILISFIMAARFEQISNRIQLYMEEIMEEKKNAINNNDDLSVLVKIYHNEFPKVESHHHHHFWREIREDYDRMCVLLRNLDRIIGTLIVLSYSCNLTFILIQLFNSIRDMETFIEGFYFFYSFGFVISRIVFVSIFAASINEQSRSPLSILNSIPTRLYNEEIERLITQIHIDGAALTGHHFFRITKGLVLSVAAAIITYELVLIQFNQTTVDKYMSSSSENPNNKTICF